MSILPCSAARNNGAHCLLISHRIKEENRQTTNAQVAQNMTLCDISPLPFAPSWSMHLPAVTCVTIWNAIRLATFRLLQTIFFYRGAAQFPSSQSWSFYLSYFLRVLPTVWFILGELVKSVGSLFHDVRDWTRARECKFIGSSTCSTRVYQQRREERLSTSTWLLVKLAEHMTTAALDFGIAYKIC